MFSNFFPFILETFEAYDVILLVVCANYAGNAPRSVVFLVTYMFAHGLHVCVNTDCESDAPLGVAECE